MLDLDLLVERMTAGGAPYGLHAPTLARGARADLCLVDLEASWTVGEAGYESRSENSCFAGRELRGRVLMTVARGAVAYRERGFAIRLAEEPGGTVAARERRVKLDRSRAALVVVDVQEAFRTAVLDFDAGGPERRDARARRAHPGAADPRHGAVPEGTRSHGARGVGAPRRDPDREGAFSAVEADGFPGALHEARRDQVLLCGIEAHVCVNQTAQDLIADGAEVHVAQDAVTSRTAENRALGLHRMERSGAVATSVETALFELLRQAGTPEFKEVRR